jgi:class 3 adenylate cyclase
VSSNQLLHKLRESQQLQFLLEYSEVPEKHVVCFIDLVNSTETVSRITSEKMVRYYEIFLNYVAQMAESFDAHIIKNLGDSVLFYFPENKKKNLVFFENCINCCINIVNKKSEMNSKMAEENLPNVNYRVSVDYGDVLLGKVSTSYVDDIIGEPVDRCQDLNHLGISDELIIGEKLYNELNSSIEYKFSKHNKSTEVFNDEYQAYLIKTDNS